MRREDWPEALARYVHDAAGLPFAWGAHDCGTFATGWVELATGMRPDVPLYASAAEFARAERDAGGMLALASRSFGEPMPHCAAAARGDIALVDADGRLCLGVVCGPMVAGPGPDGLLMVSRAAICAAWTV